MNPHRTRLQNEQRRLLAVLPALDHLATLQRSVGDPPQAYSFALRPFGFLVRANEGERFDGPEPYEARRHGSLGLSFTIDPGSYPVSPWEVEVEAENPAITIFNPHFGAEGRARGLVCWVDRGPDFVPAEWPVDRVLLHVLRMLAAESFLIEGFALQEDAKDYFHRHLGELPFEHVPDPGGETRALASRDSSTAASGIEFLGPQEGER